jgi:glycosyltransferase involved in cell wall biosynthesis
VTKRIGIHIVAYNAADTLAHVLDRIPRDFAARISAVLVFDDHSDDSTYLIGLGYQQTSDLPLHVFRNEFNRGYGGNQKAGYRWAIDNGLDIVVLLHGDGQYAPEILPDIVAALENDEADAVYGSRMMVAGAARRGGMPLYKFVGNKILSKIQNTAAGSELSEWHSGYRAYSVAALDAIPFESNSDGFDFDTQITLALLEAGKRIVEIPIPTYYGDEISRVNGIAYAREVVGHAMRYRAHKIGFGTGERAFASQEYELKQGANSSHQQIAAWLTTPKPLRILDLGCSSGLLAAQLRDLGHTVVGVDVEELPGVRDRVDEFVRADLTLGIPREAGDDFDIVLAADVLEHVAEPEVLLRDASRVLGSGGSMIACVPNIGHWYPRARIAAGRFTYERRGILDRGHLRFFTKRSFSSLARESGFNIGRFAAVGVPFEALGRGGRDGSAPGRSTRGGSAPLRVAARIDRLATKVWPTMFGYQMLFELRSTANAEGTPRP